MNAIAAFVSEVQGDISMARHEFYDNNRPYFPTRAILQAEWSIDLAERADDPQEAIRLLETAGLKSAAAKLKRLAR